MVKSSSFRNRMTTRILGHSREPVDVILNRQRSKHGLLEARIGRLMSQRADLEEIIADLEEHQSRLASAEDK
jgi:uncharacterized protein YigA (DUF484 family)